MTQIAFGLFAGADARTDGEVGRGGGCNYVICASAWGTLPHQQALRSLRLFAREVTPTFCGDIGSLA
jgi:hypothetical protein